MAPNEAMDLGEGGGGASDDHRELRVLASFTVSQVVLTNSKTLAPIKRPCLQGDAPGKGPQIIRSATCELTDAAAMSTAEIAVMQEEEAIGQLAGRGLHPHSSHISVDSEILIPRLLRVAEIAVTEEEAAAIERLQGMGFERAACIQAFIVCDRNEEAAANFLLENINDDM